MKISSLYLSLLLILFIQQKGFSQGSDTISINKIVSKVETFATNYPQEKIHVHLDKPYYALGDTIWFKAYLTTGIHVPSVLSKILYIDVTDKRDSVVKTLKLTVNNGLTWGNIVIDPAKYNQGNYHLRAYTRWMMNFNPDYFFVKTIPIGNSDKKIITHISFFNTGQNADISILYKTPEGAILTNRKVTWGIDGLEKQVFKGKGQTDANGVLKISIPKTAEKLSNLTLSTQIETPEKSIAHTFPLKNIDNGIDLQFFPESGELISGIPSKVAFKAIKSDGFGINVKGEVTDEDGKMVNTFESSHLGMGAFVLVPEEGKKYKAKISVSGITSTYALPEIKASGISITMRGSLTDTAINVRFLCTESFIQDNLGKQVYIIAKVNETIYYAVQVRLLNQVFLLSIPKNKFPTGIVQITLFNNKGLPLAERLTFVNHQDYLNLVAKSDKSTYGRRQKVRISIASKANKLPVESNLSISVVDVSKVPYDDDNEKTILSNLLLSANLQGLIEKPNYYFNRPAEKAAADLDLLMLTQGYRRFLYKDMIAGTLPKIYFLPEQGIQISGILRNSTGMPLNKASVRIGIPDKYFSAYAVTNGFGEFKFKNLVITDSSEVIISSADYSIKNPMLTVDPVDLQPQFNTTNWPGEQLNIDSLMSPYLENNLRVRRNSNLLKEVVIKGTAKVDAPSHKDYSALTGLSAWPDHMVTKDRLGNCPNFLSCITTMLTGVTFENQNFYVTRAYNAGNKTPMQIFFNGMPVDLAYLNSINTSDVESVEIFLKDELGLVNRMYSSNGVLVINGKKVEKSKMTLAQMRNLLPKAGEIKIKPQGYTISKDFYSPKYTALNINKGGDLRTTIYWNPNVKTDKITGNSLVEFHNADGKGLYKVTIEGIDAEGHIGRYSYRYKVE